jgi:putative endopeptidase
MILISSPRVSSVCIAMAMLATVASPAQSKLPDSAAPNQTFIADTPASSTEPKEPKAPHSFDLTAIDKTADPCVDFYQYACGNWRKNNPIPSDQVRWGRFNELAERNNYLLYAELKQASQPTPGRTALEKQYGDFFAACMDEKLANEKGAKPIQPLLERVAALNDKAQLAPLVADIQSKSLGEPFFSIGSQIDLKDSTKEIAGIRQGGLSLPDRDYYLENDDRMVKIRQQFTDYMVAVFKLAGDSSDQAAAEAKSVLDIETALAKASTSRTELRNPEKRYNPMEVSALEKLAPDFDWKQYFTTIDEGQLTSLNVTTPDFFKALDQVVSTSTLPQLKSYLRLQIINANAPWLSDDFFQAEFSFYGQQLQGQDSPTPRWKRCTRLTDQNLGEAVAQDWVKRYFPPDAKANMEKLVAALKTSLGEDIQSLSWMSDATKKEAEAKLELFRQNIGYPERWKNYSSIKVERDDLIGNLDRAGAWDFNYDMNKIGKPVDEKEWGMTPPTVNAYYRSSMNDINFPAGILQPPFFDNKIDPAVNFGGIGVVIGHEMTHGFDDQGSKFDGKGNLREWQTADDRKQFVAKTDCEVAEYGSFESVPGAKLNGKLTLGENTADNGGLRVAYQALMSVLASEGPEAERSIDGYTPAQRFFISFGQVWCENRTDQSARVSVKTDPHSPGEWRTNGSVQNFDEFGKAFGCKKGQPMMPENACRVW